MNFRDLERQYHILKKEMDSTVLAVLADSKNYIGGPSINELETQLADYIGVKHCITCANGTDALVISLLAWGIGSGDAVFVPDFTFFSTGESVSFVGATPVFVDVDPDTFNISPESLEKKIKEVIKDGMLRPKVAIAVDLFGLPADYMAIKKVVKQYGLLLLEDGAQGFGGCIGDKHSCGFGDISTTSFFPSKPLGCYGDGGAVFTNDYDIADLIRSLKVHGKGQDKYDNVRIGLNSRLDTIQAAILLVKFKAFRDFELNSVNKVAKTYSDRLDDRVLIPKVPKGFLSAWAAYTIRLSSCHERDKLREHLFKNDIPTMIYYPRPLHRQRAFLEGNLSQNDFVNSVALSETVLSLPIHAYISEFEMSSIIQEVNGFIKKYRKE